MRYIKKFEEISIEDVPLVGGKNASLGQMISQLHSAWVTIPTGFAITADGYWHYLEYNSFIPALKKSMAALTDIQDSVLLHKVGTEIRTLLLSGTMPPDITEEITIAYNNLSAHYQQSNCSVAVRSSATAEDLPTASFAGQQDSFLHISGITHLVESCIRCIASLFTDRAIVYRQQQHYDHFKVALSIGVQKMVNSDGASSGVAFSIDTETGFKNIVMIESSYGLGESIVQGTVTPDSFLVHKPTLAQGFTPIVKKELGSKLTYMLYGADNTIITKAVPINKQLQFSITDHDIIAIAHAVIAIEDHYSQRAKSWVPMDIEWAKDDSDNKIYIVQARPETIYSTKKQTQKITTYTITNKPTPLVTGQSIGNRIVSGIARIIPDASCMSQVQEGDIIITQTTSPDWVPVMKRAAGIVTEKGGRTCHAAIVSRELGITAIVGAQNAMSLIANGQPITLDCSQGSQGFIYDGIIPYETHEYELSSIPKSPVSIMLNMADPDSACALSFLPTDGVGLARIEFIIAQTIRVHPLALINPERVTDSAERATIDHLTAAYADKKSFFVQTLAQKIGLIAAAFYPRPVIARLSDFKTNEYRNLIGGSYFEPQEENPMLGLRGASRYTHPHYQDAFALECEALVQVRATMGLTNLAIMIPFVRTIQEAQQTLEGLAAHGLKKGDNGLTIIMMCEIPSNVLLIDQFSQLFDGFSIGSNDLTQLTLGVDRDSPLIAHIFDEQNPAMLTLFNLAIEGAHRNAKKIGICGQGPSDYPALADFLISKGIDSLSLNADSVLPFLTHLGSRK